jgi:antitoxin ParD1/3/4
MNISIDKRSQELVDKILRSGRYATASEVVREALRLLEERDRKLQALRETLDNSIAQGGEVTEEELDAALEAKAAQLTKEGF